jgi:uncharacterized membrane protein YebE (DUF533 family)
MPTVQDRVLDLGLNVLVTEATHLYVCGTAEPTTFTQATSTNALGNKNFGTGAVTGAIAAGSPNGRKVTVNAVSAGGSITATGTAAYWAITDNTNSRLLATGTLSASQSVTNGNTFTLGAFDIRLPGA